MYSNPDECCMRGAVCADIVGVNAGKQLMRRRKAVDVRTFSIVHNAIMFFASLYMVIETLRQVRSPPGVTQLCSSCTSATSHTSSCRQWPWAVKRERDNILARDTAQDPR